MQRTTAWWSSLTAAEQAEILAMPPGELESWVLTSMAAAGIKLVTAEIAGRTVRLPPTVTVDFIETKARELRS